MTMKLALISILFCSGMESGCKKKAPSSTQKENTQVSGSTQAGQSSLQTKLEALFSSAQIPSGRKLQDCFQNWDAISDDEVKEAKSYLLKFLREVGITSLANFEPSQVKLNISSGGRMIAVQANSDMQGFSATIEPRRIILRALEDQIIAEAYTAHRNDGSVARLFGAVNKFFPHNLKEQDYKVSQSQEFIAFAYIKTPDTTANDLMFIPKGVVNGPIELAAPDALKPENSGITTGEMIGPCGYYMRRDGFNPGSPRVRSSTLTPVNGALDHYCKKSIPKSRCSIENVIELFGEQAGTSQVLFFEGLTECPERLSCDGYRKCNTKENMRYGWDDSSSF